MNQQPLTIPRLRTALLVALSVSIVCFSAGVFVLVRRIFDNFGPGVKQDLAWKTVRGAQELSRSADLGLAIRDQALVQRAFADYASSEDVVAIVAQDADGQLVAAHRKVPDGVAPFEGAPLVLHESDRYLWAWAPSTIESHPVGRMAVVVSKWRLVQAQRLLDRISLVNGFAGGSVLLCGIFLVVLFTKAISRRDARLAAHATELEERIHERTTELAQMNRGMRLLLDNVGQGFVTISLDGVMAPERSTIANTWLGAPPAGSTLADAIRPFDATAAEWLDLGLGALKDGFLALELLLDQLPKTMTLGERTLRLAYDPIVGNEGTASLLVILTDVTDEIVRERVERDAREMGQVFRRIGDDREGFQQFFYEATALVAQIVAIGAEETVELRLIHTLKGNAALNGLESVAQLCHRLESALIAEERGTTEAERQELRTEWARASAMVGSMLGDGPTTIPVEERDLQALLDAIRAGAGVGQLTTLVNSWRDDRASLRLSRLAQQARYLCSRLGKPEITVYTDGGDLRLDPRQWNTFWTAMVHAVANAVDHGIEAPDVRVAQGKPERGQLWLSVQRDGRELIISIRDDGAGIDWTRLAERAVILGLPYQSREDLIAALFADGVSTRDVAGMTSGRGVGLSALKQETERLGGRIDVQSERGRETRLMFRFPMWSTAIERTAEYMALSARELG